MSIAPPIVVIAVKESAFRNGRVYLVEDDDSLRMTIEYALRDSGHDVRAFASGEEFLARFDETGPACLLLDMLLPGIDGRGVARALADRASLLPVIFLSGGATVSVATDLLRQGAFDFLVKPFEMRSLLGRVDAALAEHRSRLELAEAVNRLGLLSARELEVCGLIAAGVDSKQVAGKLGISPRTLEHHREHIYKKAGVRNLAELVALVMLARRGHTRHSAAPGDQV